MNKEFINAINDLVKENPWLFQRHGQPGGYLEYSRPYDSIHGPEESPEPNDPEKA